jgi:hypothetical protein
MARNLASYTFSTVMELLRFLLNICEDLLKFGRVKQTENFKISINLLNFFELWTRNLTSNQTLTFSSKTGVSEVLAEHLTTSWKDHYSQIVVLSSVLIVSDDNSHHNTIRKSRHKSKRRHNNKMRYTASTVFREQICTQFFVFFFRIEILYEVVFWVNFRTRLIFFGALGSF